MEFEIPAGGLEGPKDKEEESSAMYGSEEGSGLSPVKLNLDALMSDGNQSQESGNPGGGRFALRS